MSDYIDISAVDEIMEDKDLTETSIDDEMTGNLASKYIGGNRTVEFIGCSPSSNHENYLTGEFRFIQTLPRSYKIQEDVDLNDAESFTSEDMISEQNKDERTFGKNDNQNVMPRLFHGSNASGSFKSKLLSFLCTFCQN